FLSSCGGRTPFGSRYPMLTSRQLLQQPSPLRFHFIRHSAAAGKQAGDMPGPKARLGSPGRGGGGRGCPLPLVALGKGACAGRSSPARPPGSARRAARLRAARRGGGQPSTPSGVSRASLSCPHQAVSVALGPAHSLLRYAPKALVPPPRQRARVRPAP